MIIDGIGINATVIQSPEPTFKNFHNTNLIKYDHRPVHTADSSISPRKQKQNNVKVY